MVVVVVIGLGCIDGQGQVVGTQAMPLCVRVREDPGLEQLVVRVANAWHYQAGTERLRPGQKMNNVYTYIEVETGMQDL